MRYQKVRFFLVLGVLLGNFQGLRLIRRGERSALRTLYAQNQGIANTLIVQNSEGDASRGGESASNKEISTLVVNEPSRLNIQPNTSSTNNIQMNTSGNVCLTDTCIHQVATRLARAWPDRPMDTWCVPGWGFLNTEPLKDKNDQWQGMLLMKVPKCASSTSAAVVIRIGQKHNCSVQFRHREGKKYASRHEKSFFFGPVRHPAKRAMSALFFFIFMEQSYGREPNITDELVIHRLKYTPTITSTRNLGGFMLWYMRTKGTPKLYRGKALVDQPKALTVVKELMDEYNFLMVSERMDESLVVLALLTGLDLKDVMVTSSKSGKFSLQPVGKRRGQCVYLNKARFTPAVNEFLASNEWRAMHYADYVMFEAVNKSLDLTIERLGRERFYQSLAEFKRLKQRVETDCTADQLDSGCTADGLRTHNETCYYQDMGCGHLCLDEVLSKEPTSAF